MTAPYASYPRQSRLRGGVLAAALALLVVAGACAPAPAVAPAAGAADARISDPARKVAESSHGMVASASPLATAVGASILAAGGNAIDAAVATGFALTVVEPVMSGLGGRASMVVRLPSGEIIAIDGLNQVPHGYRADSGIPDAYERAAIPGLPAALLQALERWGSMSRAEVLAPAIRYAEQGFPLTADQANFIAGAEAAIREHPATARYFLKPDGSVYRAGEQFVQRDLGRTLRALADHGLAGMYSGWVADSIHADMTRHGGFVTRDELRAYEAIPAIVVRGSYRGHDVVSAFRPSAGHSVIQALHMLEAVDVPDDAAGWASVIGQAMWLALQDRNRSQGDAAASARWLTSREHAGDRAREIVLPGPVARPDTAEAPQAAPGPDRDNTTHLSTADRHGNVVALTQSLGPALGTRLAASGTGVVYATRLGSVPGSRPGSTISPTLVLHDGQVRYVLGGAGDNRIITAVIQTISRVLDHGMPLADAMAAPRVHPISGTELRLEEGAWDDGALQWLRDAGFELSSGPPTYFGRVHAIAVDAGGTAFTGVAEPRGFGGAAAPVH
ncbi:MAG TPA: gamma-glutamyltransferase [Longimicrobiales bacterium]|nr:gamma-glutamyltransferase [Longimicrobiales bacterium]